MATEEQERLARSVYLHPEEWARGATDALGTSIQHLRHEVDGHQAFVDGYEYVRSKLAELEREIFEKLQELKGLK